MATVISASNSQQTIDEVIRELDLGRCVAIPTETVYGLAADATNGEAVARIFDMKGRPRFNPLICHVSDLAMAERYGKFNAVARRLAAAFWPGPLTLVLPVLEGCGIHDLVSADLATVGLRCPSGISRDIIAIFGKPLAAPSANVSGRISPTNAEHVRREFEDQHLLIVDAGSCEVGLESTIVSIDEDQLQLLRPGGISIEELEGISGLPVAVREADGAILAPGMMKSHYAPQALMRLNCSAKADGELMLGFGEVEGDINLSARGDLREAASHLFDYLKRLDDQKPSGICVAPIPQGGLGMAINDRLARAAAPRENCV